MKRRPNHKLKELERRLLEEVSCAGNTTILGTDPFTGKFFLTGKVAEKLGMGQRTRVSRAVSRMNSGL